MCLSSDNKFKKLVVIAGRVLICLTRITHTFSPIFVGQRPGAPNYTY